MAATHWSRLLCYAFVLTLVSASGNVGVLALSGPLVQGDWLKANQHAPELVLLGDQEAPAFMRHPIPGSINWPSSPWRTSDQADPPKSLMLLEEPAQRQFERVKVSRGM